MIQGGKLSSTLYTLYTIDVTEIKEIMKSNEAYREIVDEDMSITEQNDTESTGYIDNVNHVVSTNTKEDLEIKLNQIYNLLQNIYTNKKLQMNGDKSAFITFESKYDKYS